MHSVIVDTNILVYIYSGIPNIGRKYAELLGDLSIKYNLVIPKLVYGELSLIFSSAKQLNSFEPIYIFKVSVTVSVTPMV